MATFQCAGCKKIWQAEEPPAECACGCRIVREASVTQVDAESAAAPEPAPAAPAVPSGPQPFWRRARVQGIAAACACLALAAAGWCGYAWHSAHERRRAETETYVYSSYQPSLDKAKALKAASPDRGEGFGPHLDALSAACSGAETAWGAKNQELCRTFLEKAQAELRWLDDAVPGRAKVAALRLQVDGDRSTAEREKAGEYAAAEWAAAGAAYAKADGLREKGEFASALAAYGEAGAGCRKAAASARAAHAAAAAAKFEGLFSQLSAKLDLLERDRSMTNLVAAVGQDIQPLKELAEAEKAFLPETDAGRLATAETRFRRCRVRSDFLTGLAEVETRVKGLEGEGVTLDALASAEQALASLSAKADRERESLPDADMERLNAVDAAFKKAMQGSLTFYLKAAVDKAAGLPEGSRVGVRWLLGRAGLTLGSEAFAKEQWRLAEQDAVKAHSVFELADLAERAHKRKDGGEYARLIGLASEAAMNVWQRSTIAEKQWKCKDNEGYRRSVEYAMREKNIYARCRFADQQGEWGDEEGMRTTLRLIGDGANGVLEILKVAEEQWQNGDRARYGELIQRASQAADGYHDYCSIAKTCWKCGDRDEYNKMINKAGQVVDHNCDISLSFGFCWIGRAQWECGDRDGYQQSLSQVTRSDQKVELQSLPAKSFGSEAFGATSFTFEFGMLQRLIRAAKKTGDYQNVFGYADKMRDLRSKSFIYDAGGLYSKDVPRAVKERGVLNLIENCNQLLATTNQLEYVDLSGSVSRLLSQHKIKEAVELTRLVERAERAGRLGESEKRSFVGAKMFIRVFNGRMDEALDLLPGDVEKNEMAGNVIGVGLYATQKQDVFLDVLKAFESKPRLLAQVICGFFGAFLQENEKD